MSYMSRSSSTSVDEDVLDIYFLGLLQFLLPWRRDGSSGSHHDGQWVGCSIAAVVCGLVGCSDG